MAQSKKQARQLSAMQALKNICPLVYQEWKLKIKTESVPSGLRNIMSQPASQESRASTESSQQSDKENMMLQGTMMSQEVKPSQDEDPSSAKDADLDDPELMFAKKHLCTKYTPLTVVKSLEAKHKELSFQEIIDESKDHSKNQNVYTITFGIKGFDVAAKASDYNKQRARHIAAQRFLKALFPKTYTWNKVIQVLTSLKEPLRHILDY